jgi:hypothetical protein
LENGVGYSRELSRLQQQVLTIRVSLPFYSGSGEILVPDAEFEAIKSGIVGLLAAASRLTFSSCVLGIFSPTVTPVM